MPSWGERDDLQVEGVPVLVAQVEQHLDAGEPDDRVDVGVCADERRAVRDGLVEQGAGAVADGGVGEAALELPRDGDGAGEGAVRVRAFPVEQGLVDVQVCLDEPGYDHAPGAVDHAGGSSTGVGAVRRARTGQRVGHADDHAVGDRDVDGSTVGQPCVGEDQVHVEPLFRSVRVGRAPPFARRVSASDAACDGRVKDGRTNEPSRPTGPTVEGMHRGRTLSAATAAHLGTLVLDDLQPGDKLPPERTLAEDLAVSRTTIREALQELERRRLVSRTPGRGTVVLPRLEEASALLDHHRDDLDHRAEHVAEFRTVVEPQVAGLAAARAGDADLLTLERILAATHAGLSPEESLAQDVAFHVQVARTSGNPLLVSLCELSSGWVQDVRARSHSTSEGRRSSFEWHERILDRIREHDVAGATRAMADHLADVAHLVERRTER
ncbi:FadR/GntR family transcriptional regulator [Curtobacterium flaccumfaciens pv. flaccumfaciens]